MLSKVKKNMEPLTLKLSKTTSYPDMTDYRVSEGKVFSRTILIYFDVKKEEFHQVLDMRFFTVSPKTVGCGIWIRYGEYDLRGEGCCEVKQHASRLKIVQKAFDHMGVITSSNLAMSYLPNYGFEGDIANAIADTFKLNRKYCKVITT
jgi:hypothetical protein